MLAEKNKDIQKAYDLLQIISKDEKARMLYEAREAELRDQLTRLKVAEDKGRTMGETQTALRIAEKMLRRGDSVGRYCRIPSEYQKKPCLAVIQIRI